MRYAPLVAAVLLLAGCGAPRPAPGPHFLDDGPDADVEPFADLLWAGFRELNGSVVLTLEFENMTDRIPEFTASFEVTTSSGTSTWFLRNQPNMSRPPSNIEYVVGQIISGQYVVKEQVCALTEVTDPPWTIQTEAEHRITRMGGSGTISKLTVTVGDFEGNTKDVGTSEASFSVRGGVNPYGECPLVRERPE